MRTYICVPNIRLKYVYDNRSRHTYLKDIDIQYTYTYTSIDTAYIPWYHIDKCDRILKYNKYNIIVNAEL